MTRGDRSAGQGAGAFADQTQNQGGAAVRDLKQLVKAYDVRGVVPDQWDENLSRAFGAAFVQVTGASAIVVGHDMRPPPRRSARPSPRARPATAPTWC